MTSAQQSRYSSRPRPQYTFISRHKPHIMVSNKAKNKKNNAKRNEKNRLAAAEAVAPLLPTAQKGPAANNINHEPSFK